MKKNIEILTLLTSALIFIVSVNSMEQSAKVEIMENGSMYAQQMNPQAKLEVTKDGEDKDTHSKININQLPAAKTEITMHRIMVGTTIVEQVTFDALNELKAAVEKIDTRYFNKELENKAKEETLSNVKVDINDPIYNKNST